MSNQNLLPEKGYQSIEYKLFSVTLLLTIAVFVLWSVIAVIANYTLIISLTYWGGLTIYAILYLLFRKGFSFTVLTTIYYILSFSLVALVWLPAGGITSAAVEMTFLVFVSGLLVLPLRVYIMYVVLITTLVTGYAIVEFNVPDAALPYTSRTDHVRDLGIAALIVFTVLGAAFYRFKKTYQEDREQLNKAIEELGEAKQKAEEADQAKTRFLATISHEMRTPLNGIIGLSELLEKTKLSSEQADMLKNLTYSSTVLHGLISDVLDLTLIEDGRLVLHENEIHVEEEVDKVMDTFASRLEEKEKKIELTYKHDQNIPETVCNDVTRFRQILINLINNSVKFTEEGYIRVTSTLLEENEETCTIRIEVADTGQGISKEKQHQLFTKFFKASEDVQIEGTGLGLSICKRLVEAMKGNIGFTSEEGIGSVFRFDLPFRKQSAQDQAKQDAEQKSEAFNRLNVLVAEDVKINQMVLTKMLKNLGVEQVTVVENGKLALESAKKTAFDIILMDILMPEMDGIEATKAILDHHKEAGSSAPFIIAITANAMSTDLESCMEVGMSDFISKPFTMKMLEDVFSKYV